MSGRSVGLVVRLRYAAPGVLRLEVVGEVDGSDAPVLDEVLRRAVARRSIMLRVDLGGVTFFSCAGSRVLLNAHRDAAGTLVVTDASPAVRRVASLAGFSATLGLPR